jgi:hypothetical protein
MELGFREEELRKNYLELHWSWNAEEAFMKSQLLNLAG